jgi:L-lactate dehydrogenase complex protein LldG
MGHRVLPFITQHLGMLVDEDHIVATMHDAYKKMNNNEYGFGTFIAGPSKTADIEQSLVLGAHGARSMTIFLLKSSAIF